MLSDDRRGSPKISYLQLHATSQTRPAAFTSLLYLVLPSRLALWAYHTALARGMRCREPAGHACPLRCYPVIEGALTQDQLPTATRHEPNEASRVHITAVSCLAFWAGPLGTSCRPSSRCSVPRARWARMAIAVLSDDHRGGLTQDPTCSYTPQATRGQPRPHPCCILSCLLRRPFRHVTQP